VCRAADSSIRRRTREQLDLPLAKSVKARPPPSRRHRRRMGSVVGGTIASTENELIRGVGEQSPQRGPGAEPLVMG